MATCSRLSANISQKQLKPIYCHWDGYPEYILPILNENYNTDKKVIELMSLGNLSSLGAKVKPDEGEKHSFNSPADNVTVAYHRDRGEGLEFWGNRQVYNYMYSDGVWSLEE